MRKKLAATKINVEHQNGVGLQKRSINPFSAGAMVT